MACLLVPAAEAVIVTTVTKVLDSKEKNYSATEGETAHVFVEEEVKWLTNLLWGGSALLAFEHMWNGEIVPWFPFLTAATDAEKRVVMLQEMSTVGVSMSLFVTGVWVCMLIVSSVVEKKAIEAKEGQEDAV